MTLADASTHDNPDQVVIQFINSLEHDSVKVLWVDFQGKEQQYQLLEPGHRTPQETYSTHVWRLRTTDGALVGSYQGPSAIVEAVGVGQVNIQPMDLDFTPDPSWGTWRRRAEESRIPVMAYDCVCDAAVSAACIILGCMLARCPEDVRQRLVQAGACVGIIGGRDLDATARGLGGCDGCPLTTCGEENLTMVDDEWVLAKARYPSENILIHEFAHTVMNLGMSEEQRQVVRQLYESACKLGLYAKGCYALDNADEYWAEGTQTWFGATIREDVNGGINTREKLIQHDPELAEIMRQVYGKNAWQYTDTSPSRFLSDQKASSSRPHATSTAHTVTSNPPSLPPMTRSAMRNCRASLRHFGTACTAPVQRCIPTVCYQSCMPWGRRRRAPGSRADLADERVSGRDVKRLTDTAGLSLVDIFSHAWTSMSGGIKKS